MYRARLSLAVLWSLFTLAAAHDTVAASESVYAERRKALAAKLEGGIAVLYAATGSRSVDFRQNPDFFYLTGIDEPGAILVLAPSEPVRKEMLFLPVRDPDDEIWSGERPMIGGALRDSMGFELIYRKTALNGQLAAALKHSRDLHLLTGPTGPESYTPPDLELYRKISGNNAGVSIKDSAMLLEKMRLVKDDTELARMRRAIEITYEGLKAAVAAAKPGATEQDVARALDQGFKAAGAQRHAFDPIVASGVNSTTLHYPVPSNRVLQAGDMLVLDVGAEFEGYAADITRTIPVGGRFTPEQRKVYETVLEAQAAGIRAARPGATLRGDVHDASRAVIQRRGWDDYFTHGVGHYVGLQVHDRGDPFAPLEPGMVITVEPGVYLKDVAIGVRIEDEVLITKSGSVVLSDAIPRTVEEIEAWTAGRAE
jgi:Xaa-Pro aminopeptidase